MSTHKNIGIICIAATLFAIALTILLMLGKISGVLPAVSAETGNEWFTANDLNGDWDTASATKIVLSDEGSSITGNGAYIYNGDIYIVYAGHYTLTGELTDGSVIIDADKNDKIWISLGGVNLHCEDDAAIRIEQADKVFLTLAEGTENTISSGAQYNEETIASGVDGTIYSRDDLTVNGNGSLTVNAAYYHGIVCNDDFAITGGSLTINAVQDGIHANDSVRIRNAVISVSAGDDGITVSNDDETAFLYVESGEISIPACYEGLEAIEITIAGGSIDIWPTDDGINANGSGKSSVIRITDGDIRITNPSGRDADGLDSNGSIYIEGGRIFISVSGSGGNCAVDYGSENGGECVVSGGTVIACGGSTMAEGFNADSPQGFLMYNTAAAAGATVSLKDSLGQELLSEEIPCPFSSVVISTPQLSLGDVCTIEIDGVPEQITITNTSSSGFLPVGMFGSGMRGEDYGEMGNENRGGMHGQEQGGMDNENRGGMRGQEQGEMDNENRDGMHSEQESQGGQPPVGQEADVPPDNAPSQPDDPNIPPQENDRNFSDRQDMKLPQGEGASSDENPEELPSHSDTFGGWNPSGNMEPPGGLGTSNGEARPGRQLMQESGENLPVPTLSVHALALVGISLLILLMGLLYAIRIRH